MKHTEGSTAQELDGLIDECFFVPSVDSSMAAIITDSSETLDQAQELKLALECGTKLDIFERYNMDHSKDICLVLFQYLQALDPLIPERAAQGLNVVYVHDHDPEDFTDTAVQMRYENFDAALYQAVCGQELSVQNYQVLRYQIERASCRERVSRLV